MPFYEPGTMVSEYQCHSVALRRERILDILYKTNFDIEVETMIYSKEAVEKLKRIASQISTVKKIHRTVDDDCTTVLVAISSVNLA
jgi:RNase P subunit RPR2